jgi:hypothetical protein
MASTFLHGLSGNHHAFLVQLFSLAVADYVLIALDDVLDELAELVHLKWCVWDGVPSLAT